MTRGPIGLGRGRTALRVSYFFMAVGTKVTPAGSR